MYISQSEVYFESKWSLVEISDQGVPFVEFTPGSVWNEKSIKREGRDEHYSDIYFRAATKKRFYSLEPYKILDLLGDMGGLLDIVMALGVLVTMNVVRKVFNRSLLSDAYQVQGYTENKSEFYES